MNPSAYEIFERHTEGPHALLGDLRDNGWVLIRPSSEVDESSCDTRREILSVEVAGHDIRLDRVFYTSATTLRYALFPAVHLSEQRESAWQELAVKLGEVLGVLS